MTCEHNWTMPPECPQCCAEERDTSQADNERLRADVARLRAALADSQADLQRIADTNASADYLRTLAREALDRTASVPVVPSGDRRTCQEILASLHLEGWQPDATIAAVLVSRDGTQVQVLWLDGRRAEAEVRRPSNRHAGGAP